MGVIKSTAGPVQPHFASPVDINIHPIFFTAYEKEVFNARRLGSN